MEHIEAKFVSQPITESHLSAAQCCGLTEGEMIALPEALGAEAVHPKIVAPLQALAKRTAQQGFELCVVSGYRSFDRQLAIWNAKAEGLRPVLDDSNRPVNFSELNELQRVEAIMRFSALPGASRHHWGCDVDIYDRAALTQGQSVQLLPSESEQDGPFYAFHRCLDALLAARDCEGFYRPYNVDRTGVAVEPWHFSYAPIAAQYQKSLTVPMLASIIDNSDIGFKSTILDNLPQLFQRFIALPNPPSFSVE